MLKLPRCVPQTTPTHTYTYTDVTSCTAAESMGTLMSPGISAPSAPAAQDGPTPFILLPPLLPSSVPGLGILPAAFFTPNPIAQNVSVSGGTITNTALGGHIFFPGSVTTTVTPVGAGSIIQTVGQGSGNYPVLNNALGFLFFGLRNYFIMVGCAGSGNPNNG
jgi:hypothetical protein